MPDHVSNDEYLTARKDYVKSGDLVLKAVRQAPSSWNEQTRTVRMVMSAEVEDRDRDIVIQAGLDLAKFLENPVAPLMHRSGTFPVGTWKDVEKLTNHTQARYRRTEGTLEIVPEGTDPDADRLARHIAGGTIRACSIGFIPKFVVKRDVPDDKKNENYYWPGYEIREAELLECSPVTIPANPAALAKAAQDGDKVSSEIIEMVLDTWAKHPATGLIIPRAEFEKAQKEATGGRTSVLISPKAADVSPPETQDAGQPPAEPAGRTDEVMTETEAKGVVGQMAAFLAKIFPDNAELAKAKAAREAVEMAEREETERLRKAAEEEERERLALEAQALETELVSKGLLIGA